MMTPDALNLYLSKLVTKPDFIPTQCNAYGIHNAMFTCISTAKGNVFNGS